jgi:hypothetical protein
MIFLFRVLEHAAIPPDLIPEITATAFWLTAVAVARSTFYLLAEAFFTLGELLLQTSP